MQKRIPKKNLGCILDFYLKKKKNHTKPLSNHKQYHSVLSIDHKTEEEDEKKSPNSFGFWFPNYIC